MGETNANGNESGRFSDRAKLGAAIAVIGVITPGVLNYALARVGAPTLGTLVWVLGYGLTIVALWYVLLRPVDLGSE